MSTSHDDSTTSNLSAANLREFMLQKYRPIEQQRTTRKEHVRDAFVEFVKQAIDKCLASNNIDENITLDNQAQLWGSAPVELVPKFKYFFLQYGLTDAERKDLQTLEFQQSVDKCLCEYY